MAELEGKRAFVTGAGRGIGAAICAHLASKGAIVAVNDRDAEPTRSLIEEIQKKGGKAHAVIGDVSTAQGAEDVAERVSKTLERVDVLVNNVGNIARASDPLGPPLAVGWEKLDREDYVYNYNLCVMPLVHMVRHFAPGMRDRGWGRIVSIASTLAWNPSPLMPQYSAHKAAILNLTVAYSKSLAPHGITVNAVSPGPILSAGYPVFIAEKAKSLGWEGDFADWERRDTAELGVSVGRYGRPEEVAALVGFLASPDAGFITGSNHRIDGGLCATIN